MYCIERLDHGGQWIQEICFKTEFKAFVNARTKSRATLKTYRVVHATWNQVVTVVQGSCLLYTSPSPRDVEESRMPSSA